MIIEIPKPGLYIVDATEAHTTTGEKPTVFEIGDIALDRSLSRETVKDLYLWPTFAHTVTEHAPNLAAIRREKGIA